MISVKRFSRDNIVSIKILNLHLIFFVRHQIFLPPGRRPKKYFQYKLSHTINIYLYSFFFWGGGGGRVARGGTQLGVFVSCFTLLVDYIFILFKVNLCRPHSHYKIVRKYYPGFSLILQMFFVFFMLFYAASVSVLPLILILFRDFFFVLNFCSVTSYSQDFS